MIYLLFGKQSLMIKNNEKKIIASFSNEEIDKIKINYDESSIEEIIEECNQFSLISEKKVVVVKNASNIFLDKGDKKEYKELINYIKNENELTLLIFEVNEDNINDNNKIVVALKENNKKIVKLKDLSKEDWVLYVRKYFEKRGVTIEEEAINEIAIRSDEDLNVFTNEVNKLLLYKQNFITLKDVKKIFTKPLEENAFDLLNALLKNDKSLAFSIYKDLRVNNFEVISLISLLTTSLLFYDEVGYLLKEKKPYEIATILNANQYRVKITCETLVKIGQDRIKKALEELYLLDKQIKHSEIDRFYGFELFLINF